MGFRRFRPPYGVWVVSAVQYGNARSPRVSVPLRGCRLFHEPIDFGGSAQCFRPLTGCWLFPRYTDHVLAGEVSVPLRGVGCFSKTVYSFLVCVKRNCQFCRFIVSYCQAQNQQHPAETHFGRCEPPGLGGCFPFQYRAFARLYDNESESEVLYSL